MSELGYSPKNLKFDEAAREKLQRGIALISKAVKSTLGPHGQTVLIESPEHTHGITVTKDGVTVAKAVSLIDPVENLAVRIMKAAAEKTGLEAGDGTTTSIVLAEELVNQGFDLIKPTHNKTEVLRHLSEQSEKIIAQMKKASKAVTKKNLPHVATISANNDKVTGKLIADTYKAVGKKGIVKADTSLSGETYAEVTKGIRVQRGYSSNAFVNNQERDECILEDTYVLVSDQEITNFMSIEHLLTPVVKGSIRLLIIAPVSGNTLNTLGANVIRGQGQIKLCVVAPPDFGYRKEELMADIAVATGATYFSEKTGDDLSLIKQSDLGRVDRAIIGKDSTVLIQHTNDPTEAVKARVEQLQEAHAHAKTKRDKEFIDMRIATLIAGVGVVYVGGETDLERKELYDRVDDAICAVRSALEEGVIVGGGLGLCTAMANVLSFAKTTDEDNIAKLMLERACLMPLDQIILNAGLDSADLYKGGLEKDFGYDVKNKVWGNMYEMGIIDPLKVTKNALRNAVSVATTILSTNAVISMARTFEDG